MYFFSSQRNLCIISLHFNSLFFPKVLLDGKKIHPEKMNQISFSSVPECLLYSLQFVDFDTKILDFDAELELVKYFLQIQQSSRNSHYKWSIAQQFIRSHSSKFENVLRTNCQVIMIWLVGSLKRAREVLATQEMHV